MTDKYKNKYRIASNRMPGWDYSGNGYYFITMVTQNRKCNLGKIATTNGRVSVIFSGFGKIVDTEWKKSFEMRNELFCDGYIIMPNHLHAIIILKKTENDNIDGSHNLHVTHVETHGRASLQSPHKQIFIRKPKSISSFISGFKSAVNSKIDDYIDVNNLDIPKYNRNNHFFQSNYHDHIIRNNGEYYRIKNYIINNPKKWIDDKYNPNNTADEL